ncbi:MAG: hypothetical protein KC766_10620 [Myxococcales bacterium]|nr:hypothetical protein [Myxococcales bacterium]
MTKRLLGMTYLVLLGACSAASTGSPGGQGAAGSGGSAGSANAGSGASAGSGGTGGSGVGGEGNSGATFSCEGVTCTVPPESRCDVADPDVLISYQVPGVCDNGACSYAEQRVACSDGCVDGACVGDPCAGVTCNTPPDNACNGSDLIAYDPQGTCTGGDCDYTSQTLSCADGCDQGACVNDPCAGVSCVTPPADACASASSLRHYSQTGTCGEGGCDYSYSDETCAFGCAAAKCLDCSSDQNCGSGNYCAAGTCTICDTDTRCGAACANCQSSGQHCDQTSFTCVECLTNAQCGTGKRCVAGSCQACTSDAHCGASCAPCGSNQRCTGSACEVCKSDSACGATCSACSGATPYCMDLGASSTCVECRSSSDCGAGESCDASGTCRPPCPTTLTPVFSDSFGTPSSSSYTKGFDVPISGSPWRAITRSSYGVRIYSGRLEVLSSRSDHGQGYAYVTTAGGGAAYDTSLYDSVLSANAGQDIVWSFNFQRSNPSDSTSGGFACSSSSNQNGRTVGVAYVLASDSATGLDANDGTCSPSATAKGYAVLFGPNDGGVRLVRFTNGLRNGAITNLVQSGGFTATHYLSARVTYSANTNTWKLEARSDGSSSFSNPATGSYGFSGTQVDATYTGQALNYSGPYFQGGCVGNCSGAYTARFDNVSVGTICSP